MINTKYMKKIHSEVHKVKDLSDDNKGKTVFCIINKITETNKREKEINSINWHLKAIKHIVLKIFLGYSRANLT